MSQDAPDLRIQDFELIAHATSMILQHLGRPDYLVSLCKLWSGIKNALVIFEQMTSPEQQPQTTTHLALPPHARPMSALLEATIC